MTYQGKRATPMATENGKCFEVTKVRLGRDGHVSEVLWSEVSGSLDQAVGARVVASAAEVVDAIHDGAQVDAVFSTLPDPANAHLPKRAFEIVEHADGRECIALQGASSPGRDLSHMELLEG